MSLPHYTLDQIATQLTDDYWRFQGGGRRAFDLGADRTLTYDMGSLSKGEQYLVSAALKAWSNVSGIRFVDVGLKAGAPVTYEYGDVGAGTYSGQELQVGSTFEGNISSGSDEDWLKVSLTAGQTYTIAMEAIGAGGMGDPMVQLLDARGYFRASNDDGGNGTHSSLTYTPTSSGTYYINATSGSWVDSGDYRLTLRKGKAADLTFTNDNPESGAWSTSELFGSTITSSLINIEPTWNNAPLSLNSYWFQTYIHEIGHALGLGHGGNYNGDAIWPRDAHYAEDSVMFSIMSYFFQAGSSEEVNPNYRGDWAYVVTPMAADIKAIQELYGLSPRTNKGDTTYGSDSNVGGYLGALFAAMFDDAPQPTRVWRDQNIAFTIHDRGGYDTMDFSTIGKTQVIRLEPGSFSSVGGYRQNMGISEGTVIEAAITGRGNDKLYGSGRDNLLSGGAGRDTIQGGGGNDTLIGGSGNDRLTGGSGRDLADYSAGRSDMVADLMAGKAKIGGRSGSTDTLKGIENLHGGSGDDLLKGNRASNALDGMGGHDTLRGNAGNDILTGGRGNDLLAGGSGNDALRGDAGADRFVFDGGRDRIADFNAGQRDRIAIDRDLWESGTPRVRDLLAGATVTKAGVTLNLGADDRLLIADLRQADELQGHIFFI